MIRISQKCTPLHAEEKYDTLAILQLRILDHDLQHAKIASDVYEQLASQNISFEALMFVYSSSSSSIINIQRACYTTTEK